MSADNSQRYAFMTEWIDPQAGITWKYQFLFFVKDNSIEMIDIKNKRTFLKRVAYPGVKLDQLFLGATVTVYSRQLKVVDFADDFTRRSLGSSRQTTFAMVKPGAFKHAGKIVHAISQNGFILARAKMVHLSDSDARAFYSVHTGKPFFERLIKYITSGPVLGMELVADNAIAKWRALLGPTDTYKARAEAPDSIRAHFGVDGTDNAAHGSDAAETAAEETAFFFGPKGPRAASRVDGSTALALVKPHAVAAGQAGLIIDAIGQSMVVTGLQLFSLDRTNACEFYEVYKGVMPEYSHMVEDLTSGSFFALEVADRSGAQAVQALRELVGPADPEVARLLRPDTLRAHFGTDKVHNSIHCTDLPEDGQLEANYFFRILQQ